MSWLLNSRWHASRKMLDNQWSVTDHCIRYKFNLNQMKEFGTNFWAQSITTCEDELHFEKFWTASRMEEAQWLLPKMTSEKIIQESFSMEECQECCENAAFCNWARTLRRNAAFQNNLSSLFFWWKKTAGKLAFHLSPQIRRGGCVPCLPLYTQGWFTRLGGRWGFSQISRIIEAAHSLMGQCGTRYKNLIWGLSN